MSISRTLAAVFVATMFPLSTVHAAAPTDALRSAVAGTNRSQDHKVRDPFRRPLATLAFFDIRPDATIVEISPGGGYWTEILAPYLREKGTYIPAVGTYNDGVKKFTEKFGGNPAVYGDLKIRVMDPPKSLDLAPAGTADFVLTFRNVHNWMKAGTADEVFAAFARALKPGGILGVEEHRADTTKPQDPKALSGYVREDYVIALAKKAGFTVVAKSSINANPKDTKDYPKGVWTLPPSLRLGEKDREKYVAIGESDRMLLMFRLDKGAAK